MRKVFALFGTIAIDGMSTVKKELSGLDKNLQQLSKEMRKTGRQMVRLGSDMTKTFTAPIVAGTAAIGVMTNSLGLYADKLLDLEQITGLSTENLQKFEHVSKVAGVSFDGLVSIITKFTNQLPELEKGGNAASEAFGKLGVSIRNGEGDVRSMNDLFPEMLNALQGVENVTERNALAQDIFGRSLTDLAPVLGLTKEGLNSAMREAEGLGIILGGKAITAANNFRIEAELLKEQLTVAGRDISTMLVPVLRDDLFPIIKHRIIPAIKSMSERLVGAISWFTELSGTTKKAIIGMIAFTAAVGPMILILGKLLISLSAIRTSMLLLNAVFVANPIGLVITAVVGLTAAFIALNHSQNASIEKQKQWNKESEYGVAIAKAMREEYEKNPLFDSAKFKKDFRKRWDAYNDSGKNSMQEMQKTRRKFDEQEKKEAASVIKEKTSLTKNQSDEIAAYEEKQQDKLNQLVHKSMEDVRRIRAANLEAVKKAEKEAADYAIKEKERAAKEAKKQLDDENDHWAMLHRQKLVSVEEMKSAIVNAVNQGFNIFSAFNSNTMMAEDNRYKKNLKAIENSQKTEEEKAAAIEALDAKYEKKQNAARRRQAIADKAQAMFDIFINTAVSVSKMLWNPVLAAIIGGLGAVQEIAVAAKPIPAEKGVYLPGSESGTLIQAGENKKSEIVLPLTTGVDILANKLIHKFSSGGTMPTASSGASQPQVVNHTHLHAGTVVADRGGLKKLERILSGVRLEEAARIGAIS